MPPLGARSVAHAPGARCWSEQPSQLSSPHDGVARVARPVRATGGSSCYATSGAGGLQRKDPVGCEWLYSCIQLYMDGYGRQLRLPRRRTALGRRPRPALGPCTGDSARRPGRCRSRPRDARDRYRQGHRSERAPSVLRTLQDGVATGQHLLRTAEGPRSELRGPSASGRQGRGGAPALRTSSVGGLLRRGAVVAPGELVDLVLLVTGVLQCLPQLGGAGRGNAVLEEERCRRSAER